MALRAGSPAFNAGSNALAKNAAGQPLSTDQRGRPRVAGGAVDIGAYEAQLPVAPTMVTSAAGPDEVQVSWAPDPDAATYNVYRSTDPAAPGSPVATGITVRGFFDTTVTAGVTYYYRVTAVNAMGEGMPSGASTAIAYLPIIEGTAGDDMIRLTPVGDQVHIKWTLGGNSGTVRIDDPVGLTINGNGGTDTIAVFTGYDVEFPNLTHFNGTFIITGRVAYLPQPGQTWDINRSTIYFNSAGIQDNIAYARDELRAGYNGGTWDGAASPDTGLITSTAARNDASHSTAIGFADSSDGTGLNQTPNTIELKYTVAGDANLDGVVDSNDAVIMARNYMVSGKADWDQGNFNYDSAVDSGDARILQANFGKTLTAASVGSAAGIVPPTSAGTGTPVVSDPGDSSKPKHGYVDHRQPSRPNRSDLRDMKKPR